VSGMEAKDGEFEGSFLAGDAYNANGDIVNSDSMGGIVIPRNSYYRPKLYRPSLQGAVSIGDTPNSSITIGCLRSITQGANVVTNMYIHGTMTFDQIKNQMNAWNVPKGGVFAVPVSGSLYYNYSNNVYRIIASCIDSTVVNNDWEYRLRGMDTFTGQTVLIILTGNQSASVDLAFF